MFLGVLPGALDITLPTSLNISSASRQYCSRLKAFASADKPSFLVEEKRRAYGMEHKSIYTTCHNRMILVPVGGMLLEEITDVDIA